jgi:hypothetical protein
MVMLRDLYVAEGWRAADRRREDERDRCTKEFAGELPSEESTH